MGIRSDWNESAVFSECPTCRHLGPHQPDALGMLRCDVCGTVFAAGPAGDDFVDDSPDAPTTTSWFPKLPDD